MRATLLALGSAYRLMRSLLLNLLFIAFVAGLVGLVAAGFAQRPKVPSKAALVLDPRGTIVEEVKSRSPRDVLEGAIGDSATQETRLKDILDALKAAKNDTRIQAVYLDLGSLWGAGTTTQRELGEALVDFRKSGKKVVAYADNYAQVRYFLAESGENLLDGNRGVLDDVVKEGGYDHRFRAVGPDQDAGHGQRVDDVRDLRALPDLAVMSPGRQLNSIVEPRAICFSGLRHAVRFSCNTPGPR